MASAQVKSSILLAGLVGHAFALITEPRQSRDHTERLLRSVGVSVLEHATQGFIRSAGHLGWAFPAGLGAKCAAPGRPAPPRPA